MATMHLSPTYSDCEASSAEELLKLELRFLKPNQRTGLSNILSSNDTIWKSFMGAIPRSVDDDSPKYTMEHINIVDAAYKRLHTNPVEIILDEWSTTGRVRPTVSTLIRVLNTSDQFNQALYYVNTYILALEDPSGPIEFPEDDKEQSRERPSQAVESSRERKEVCFALTSSQNAAQDVWRKETNMERLEGDEDVPSVGASIHTIQLSPTKEGPCSLLTDLPRLNYHYLADITNNFSEVALSDGGNKLGKGSFGSVYHGVMHGQLGINGSVAVKRLVKGPPKTDAQFNIEIECMRYVEHRNILSLLAYSNDGNFLCLVYEYMDNGNLADRLRLTIPGTVPLNSLQRLRICIDCAEGLSYLHNHTHEKSLVHRDIKPENILLDSSLTAKISDFGLVRLTGSGDFGLSIDQTSTLMGTPLYMAPEAMRGEVSDKMDVYSFGVVLLEIITSIPAIGDERTSHQSLVSFIEDAEEEHEVEKLVDPVFSSDNGMFVSHKQLYNIAEQCLNLNRKKRPRMDKVLQSLETLMS